MDGIATSSHCPRSGLAKLWDYSGGYIEIPTKCKTWRCKGCRNRLIGLFKARVQMASLTLAPCCFTTVTYAAGGRTREAASYVKQDWKAFWRLLSRSGESSPKWLRVMEVTKKGTPHHHLLMGPILTEMRCYGNWFDVRRFQRRFDSCECWSHTMARAWYQVTGDSYITHVVPTIEGAGAGGYMAKYLTKTFGMEGRLKTLGMTRRWSTSKGFPRWDLRLKNEDWSLVMHIPGHTSAEERGTPELLERKGSDIVLEVAKSRKRKMPPNVRRIHAANDSP